MWANCQVYKEVKTPTFIMLRHLLCGVHMINEFVVKKSVFYLDDIVDGDTFLRAGN
jgi:hypothetical protein